MTDLSPVDRVLTSRFDQRDAMLGRLEAFVLGAVVALMVVWVTTTCLT